MSFFGTLTGLFGDVNSDSVGGSMSRNRIEIEAKEIDELLTAAKLGKWDKVWEILGSPDNPKRDYLINCIPGNRRWGVIHQAVWWNNQAIMRKVLQFNACDADIKAKECTSEVGNTGAKTALEIAEAYKYPQMVVVLKQHESKPTVAYAPLETFLSSSIDLEDKGLGLIAITLASYKSTFHPKDIARTRRHIELLADIFNDLNENESRWKAVREKVCESLYVVNQSSSKNIKETTRLEFYKSIINVYTEESTYLYTHVNTALRRQRASNYRPTARDLAIGPYVIMYQILLLLWPELKRESKTTYRKMLLSNPDLAKYKVGVRFSWPAFVSSTVAYQHAMAFPTCETDDDSEYNTVFTIDNSLSCSWQPRNIESFARYHERERVYPAGARFRIVGRKEVKEETHIALTLER